MSKFNPSNLLAKDPYSGSEFEQLCMQILESMFR